MAPDQVPPNNFLNTLANCAIRQYARGMTTSPKRIQRKRTKGWKKPEGAVYVGRGTDWESPYQPGPGVDRMPWLPEGKVLTVEECVAAYREMVLGMGGELLTPDKYLGTREGTIRHFLRGKDLMCWCPLDQPCHADVLLEIANRED